MLELYLRMLPMFRPFYSGQRRKTAIPHPKYTFESYNQIFFNSRLKGMIFIICPSRTPL